MKHLAAWPSRSYMLPLPEEICNGFGPYCTPINAAFSRNIKRLAQRRAELSGAPEKQNHSEKSDASLPKQARTPLDPHPEHPVLNLQQAIGNQAVMRLMQPQTGGAVGEHKALHDP